LYYLSGKAKIRLLKEVAPHSYLFGAGDRTSCGNEHGTVVKWYFDDFCFNHVCTGKTYFMANGVSYCYCCGSVVAGRSLCQSICSSQ